MSEQRRIVPIIETAPPKTFLEKLLDGVETVGNKVPHPAVIFFILAGLVIVLSHLFYLLGTSVDYEVVNPQTHKVEHATAALRGGGLGRLDPLVPRLGNARAAFWARVREGSFDSRGAPARLSEWHSRA
jgi:putative AbgT family transporter